MQNSFDIILCIVAVIFEECFNFLGPNLHTFFNKTIKFGWQLRVVFSRSRDISLWRG